MAGKHTAPEGQLSTFQQMGNRINRDHQPKHQDSSQPEPRQGSGPPAGTDLPSRGGSA